MNLLSTQAKSRRWLPWLALCLALTLGWSLQRAVFAESPEEMYAAALKLYTAQDYTGAQDILAKLNVDYPNFPQAVDVGLKLVDCYRRTIPQTGKVEQWQDGQAVIDGLLARHDLSNLDQARIDRLAANYVFEWPHFGYETAGKLERGNYRGGGVYKETFVEDREKALDFIRASRECYEKELAAEKVPVPAKGAAAPAMTPLESETIAMYFDLARIAAWDNTNLWQEPPHPPKDKELPAEVTWQETLSDKGLWTYATQRIVALDQSPLHTAALRARYLEAMFLKRYYGLTSAAATKTWQALPPAEDPNQVLKAAYQQAPAAKDLPDDQARVDDVGAECLYAAGAFEAQMEHYNEAIDDFKTVIQERPKSKYKAMAATAITSIEEPSLNSGGGQTGTQTLETIDDTGKLTPHKISMSLQVRNIKSVKFTATPVDLVKAISSDSTNYWQMFQVYYGGAGTEPAVMHFRSGDDIDFSRPVEDKGDHQYKTVDFDLPFDKPGAWVVEASIGSSKVRELVVASDLMLVCRATDSKPLVYVADAVTGKPAEGAEVTFLDLWWNRRQNVDTLGTATVGKEGTVDLPANANQAGHNLMLIATRHDPKTKALLSVAITQPVSLTAPSWNPSAVSKVFSVTDRPVYRPGQTVHFKHTLRVFKDNDYTNPGAGANLLVQIYDSKGAKLYEQNLTTNAFGTVFGDLKLSEHAALGQYNVVVSENGRQWNTVDSGGAVFRVEEYKKPEYEVTVTPDTKQARVGGVVHATISAKYYYGAPVTQATVQYRVERKKYNFTWTPAGQWDWLYGPCYGCCWYWPYWWYRQPVPDQELVMEGEAPIGPDGTVKIDIDTAPIAKQFPDEDSEYTVTATVRDQSRRNIDGSGAVIVTRAPYYAVLSTENGYCWWGGGNQNVEVRVATQKPDGTPVASKGTIDVFETQYNWQNNTEDRKQIVTGQAFAVDDTGSALYDFKAPEPGQYEVVYTSKSAWGTDVSGSTRVWDYGAGFDGRKYKTQNLEIITDKRTYQPGDVAHVMINAGTPDATVLLFNEIWYSARDVKILHLTDKTLVVDVPITKADVPNFFLSAATVRNGELIQETREVCVPPAKELLNVTLTADKKIYKPGEKMTVNISATDQAGKPVAAELDLSVFDKSILYIQPEYGADVKTFFLGQCRQRYGNLVTSTATMGWPAVYSLNGGNNIAYPPAWMGNWGTAGEFNGVFFYRDRLKKAELDNELGPADAPNAGGGRFGGPPGAVMEMAAAGAPMARQAMAQNGPAAPMAAGVGGGSNAMQAKPGAPAYVPAVVRSNFADAAFWQPDIVTDAAGKATVNVPMPENLTGWVVNMHAITADTKVASARIEVVTKKNLLVRLQAPRFLVQHDEAVISANVMNYLPDAKQAKVSLAIGGKSAELFGAADQTVTIPAGGEARVDWRIHVLHPGQIDLTATALTDEESDAMKISLPAVVYGLPIVLTKTQTLHYGSGDAEMKMSIPLPKQYDPDQSKLEVSYTPTLAGGMLDAMPYLVNYPYGCTEQTMSRYLPTVVVSDALAKTGVDLDAIRRSGKRPPEAQPVRGPYGDEIYYPYFYQSPVFDKDKIHDMVQAGLNRLYSFQHGDGGWGWWQNDSSNTYMTAYVVYGLAVGQEAHEPVAPAVIQRGAEYLLATVNNLDLTKKPSGYDYETRGPEGLAFIAEALASSHRPCDKLVQYLAAHQNDMSDYGRALSVCALAKWGKSDEAKKALKDLLTHVVVDKESDTAALADKHGEDYCYWYWYNDNIEANAWTLQAIMAVDPSNAVAPQLVRWLLAQRHGFRWYSTRDTAMCLYAMTDYLEKSQEANCDYTLTVDHEGIKKTVAISAANMFDFDCRYVLEGQDVVGSKPDANGTQEVNVDLTRKGKGAVYATMALQVYTQDENIPAGGNQMAIERKYFKLTPKTVTEKTRNAQGEVVEMPVLKYDRTELKPGDKVMSGDRIEVELTLTTPFEYEYLAIEDWKPAGCEPVDLTSDAETGVDAWWTHRELHDQKVTFFVTWLRRGKATLTYQLRAETPGVFHVLPAQAYLMYTPEIRANSTSFTMPIEDTPVLK